MVVVLERRLVGITAQDIDPVVDAHLQECSELSSGSAYSFVGGVMMKVEYSNPD